MIGLRISIEVTVTFTLYVATYMIHSSESTLSVVAIEQRLVFWYIKLKCALLSIVHMCCLLVSPGQTVFFLL